MSKLMYFIGGLLTAGLGMAAYVALNEDACYAADDDVDANNDMAANKLDFADDATGTDEAFSTGATDATGTELIVAK